MSNNEPLTKEKLLEEIEVISGDIHCYAENALENDEFRQLQYAYNMLSNLKELLDIIKGRLRWRMGAEYFYE